MVVSREQAKKEFAQRLNEALDEMKGCPSRYGRGRAAWVARRYGVSGEAVRKWLDGVVMPDQTNVARIAKDLNVTPQWLHAGQLPKRPLPDDPMAATWSDVWEALSETGRAEVLSFANWKAGRANKPEPNQEP